METVVWANQRCPVDEGTKITQTLECVRLLATVVVTLETARSDSGPGLTLNL